MSGGSGDKLQVDTARPSRQTTLRSRDRRCRATLLSNGPLLALCACARGGHDLRARDASGCRRDVRKIEAIITEIADTVSSNPPTLTPCFIAGRGDEHAPSTGTARAKAGQIEAEPTSRSQPFGNQQPSLASVIVAWSRNHFAFAPAIRDGARFETRTIAGDQFRGRASDHRIQPQQPENESTNPCPPTGFSKVARKGSRAEEPAAGQTSCTLCRPV